MEQLIIIFHVLVALGIVGLILLQQGKGADMGASFGAGASQTLFGSGGGGNVLTKSTALLATLFFITSFALAVVAKNKAANVDDVDVVVPAVVEGASMPDLPADGAELPAANTDIPAALDASGAAGAIGEEQLPE